MMFHLTLTVLCPSVVNHLMVVATGAQSQRLKCFRLGRKVFFNLSFLLCVKKLSFFYLFFFYVLILGQSVSLLTWCIGSDEILNVCIILRSLPVYSIAILLSLCKFPSCIGVHILKLRICGDL